MQGSCDWSLRMTPKRLQPRFTVSENESHALAGGCATSGSWLWYEAMERTVASLNMMSREER
jgi:hypothetical protein